MKNELFEKKIIILHDQVEQLTRAVPYLSKFRESKVVQLQKALTSTTEAVRSASQERPEHHPSDISCSIIDSLLKQEKTGLTTRIYTVKVRTDGIDKTKTCDIFCGR